MWKSLIAPISVLCLLLMVMACRTVPNDSLIIPGKRVGNLQLRHLREPDLEKDDALHAKYNNQGFSLGFDKDLTLSVIEVTRDNYKTVEGIGVGSTEAEILDKYGRGKVMDIPLMDGETQIALLAKRAIHYPGICFTINDEGKVRSIIVSNKEVN